FSTTTVAASGSCESPTARLYAMTFLGGAAYDTNDDGRFDRGDSTLVKTIVGVNATPPFVADRHLVFGAGGPVAVVGGPDGFNNGRAPAGVRIVSWREIR